MRTTTALPFPDSSATTSDSLGGGASSRLSVRSEISVAASDGTSSILVQITRAFFEPNEPVVLLLPAMGTEASYYEPFARALVSAGAGTVALLDLRGQGRSSERASHFSDFGYREIVELDLPAAVAVLRGRFPNRPLLLAGHSLGGQVAALFAARQFAELGPTARSVAGIDGLLLLAAGTGHVDAWRGSAQLRARLTALWTRVVSALTPYYPGRWLGFGGNQPRRLMRDWSQVARTGLYRLEGSTFDYETAMRTCEVPVLSLRIDGDPIAPSSAADALVAKFAHARVESHVVPGVPRHRPWKRHFSWARNPESVLSPILFWIARRHFARR